MSRLAKRTCISFLVVLLIGRPVFAQEWTDWDSDSDGPLTFGEFSQGLAIRLDFADWDTDGNGKLLQEEIGSGVFSSYDRDTTQAIEETKTAGLEGDFGADGLWEPEGVTDIEAVDSETTADAPGDVVTPDEVVDVDPAERPNWENDGDTIIVA